MTMTRSLFRPMPIAFLLASLLRAGVGSAAPTPSDGSSQAAPAAATPEKTAGQVAHPVPTSSAELKSLMSRLSREELAAVLKRTPPENFLRIGQGKVAALNVYSMRLTKQERVAGRLHEPQTSEVVIREKPLAVRMEVVQGPGTGRKVLYNSELNPGALRAKESGFLGIVGAVWVGVDSSMSRKDTNHSVKETTLSSLLNLIDTDLKKGQAFGGHQRKDEGFDESGAFCMLFTAPPGASGLYAESTRICVDPALGLPAKVEVFDKKGLLERYRYANVAPKAAEEKFFTPEAAGL